MFKQKVFPGLHTKTLFSSFMYEFSMTTLFNSQDIFQHGSWANLLGETPALFVIEQFYSYTNERSQEKVEEVCGRRPSRGGVDTHPSKQLVSS